jgi:serine/threonine protein kinase
MKTIGKYRILAPIDLGGMRTLFKAYDAVADRFVALRVIRSTDNFTEELKARLYGEAQAWAYLDHPNIVRVFELAEHEGQLLLAMELLEGDELAELIAQREPLRLEDKLALMIQICDALYHVHAKGVIHGHVNPRNIFVLRNGQVKIFDFGLAWLTHADAGLSRTGSLMMAPRYMAPEQARGHVDPRADIFSVGAVFYELLTFRPAFSSDDPMEILDQLRWDDPPPLPEIDPTLPPGLIATIERALRKNPHRRFPNLAEMRSALEFIRRRLADEALLAVLAEYVTEVRELRAASSPEASMIDDSPARTDMTVVSAKTAIAGVTPRSGRQTCSRSGSGWWRAVGWREGAIAAAVLLALGVGVSQLSRPGLPTLSLPHDLTRPSPLAGDAAPGAIRTQMRAAREGAAEAKARRLAPRLWASAVEKERQAEAALSQPDVDRAQVLFADAEKTYHEAWRKAAALAAAEGELLAGFRREARAAEQAAESARRDAERAGVAWSAPPSAVLAHEREMEARAARDRQEYGLAGRRFREAQQEYQRAALEARLVTSKGSSGPPFAAPARPAMLEQGPRRVSGPISWGVMLGDMR